MREIFSRFSKYMELNNLNDNQVTMQCGLSQGLLGQARTGKSDLGKKSIEKILKTYQDINRVWLLTGEGEMLNKSSLTPEVIEDNIGGFYTYKLPISAMGGDLIGFDLEGVNPRDCERILSPVCGVDMAIPIVGDSMAPDYPSGCTVFVKRIDPTAFINWGNAYVLDTTNGTILKIVDPSDKDGYITCYSLNPSGRYKPFDVPMRSIRAMYRVVASISLR